MLDKALDNFLNDKITDFSEIGENVGKKDITKGKNLDNLAGISISIASPEQIRDLSYGKVLISETINYRTQKPERGGLFCEQIFGPRKNYECSCGKYKRIRYKGIVCERCGVEVTKSSVRRDRMGHIDLYAPVTHTWFLKSVPSRIGLLLDLPVKKLEQVVYFASYIITEVYEDKRAEALRDLEDRFKVSKAEMQQRITKDINDATLEVEAGNMTKKAFKEQEMALMGELDELTEEFEHMKSLVNTLRVGEVMGELDYRVVNDKFPHIFKGGTGAEHLKTLLERIDLKQFIKDRQEELKKATAVKRNKILQKIKLASNLLKSDQRPEWFVLEVLPIIPPDLRPMIQLDGGRFASSDLNDLYRRVINRNNRLKKLIELGAPEVILKNEKRMLQESVDMLFTGESRTNRSGFVSATKRKLKSLTDVLKGKQGRFRQNLLGKRVDYSARSVIVVGPTLNMDECGIPKSMALTLFKPFVIGNLIEKGLVYNVKHAEKYIEDGGKEVWDALDEVIQGKYVLLNRAPTLHRLSIQAFKPVLIGGKSIQLHPLTCSAFNADFDGDQMAVHLPITHAAQKEARELMVTSKNLLTPSSGDPIVSPSQDMVLGCYYLTRIKEVAEKDMQVFAGIEDATIAFDNEAISYHTQIKVRVNNELKTTTYGRLLFNEIVPEGLGFINETVGKGGLKKVLADSFEFLGIETTAQFADDIKNLGYEYATKSGLSISKEDMMIPKIKTEIIEDGEEKVKEIQKGYWRGLLTEDEKYRQSIIIWAGAKTEIEKKMKEEFFDDNHIFNLVDSGARGNWGQITQLCGMKGLVASPSGKTIELPIKSNLKEGFSTLEYFNATHGGRKGKSDTALKTAQSGYLTRRLVDASQSILVKENDCATLHFKDVIREKEVIGLQEKFEDKIFSRTLARDAVNEKGEIIASEGSVIDKDMLKLFTEKEVNKVSIRSVLTCETEGGVCQKCYGLDLGSYEEALIGTPVGVVAAQSIGEPGTQLTMRTFHSGGVAKEGGDMTQGLARVEELFEARTPKVCASIAKNSGVVEIHQDNENTYVNITASELETEEYYFSEKLMPNVKEGQEVKARQMIAKHPKEKGNKVTAKHPGIVKKIAPGMIVIKDKVLREESYKLDLGTSILVTDGEVVERGDKLTEGALSIKEVMDVSGVLKAEEYITNEIKSIYASQGQTVNSKHVELIVRQMFSKVRIIDKGDSPFFPGDIVDIIRYKKVNDELRDTNKQQAIGERLLLGLTKISLFTDSWLSAASFQETVRVLVESAVSNKIDKLTELKENVIIGRKIPAGEQYRKMFGFETPEELQEAEYFDNDEIDYEDSLYINKMGEELAKED